MSIHRLCVRTGRFLVVSLPLVILATSPLATADPGKQPQLGPEAQRFDADRDGKLSPEEAKAMREERAKERLRRIDTNGDGKISQPERKAAADADRARRAKEADTDGDGVISAAEREEARLKRLRELNGTPE